MRKLVNLSKLPGGKEKIHSQEGSIHRVSIYNGMFDNSLHTFPHLHSTYY